MMHKKYTKSEQNIVPYCIGTTSIHFIRCLGKKVNNHTHTAKMLRIKQNLLGLIQSALRVTTCLNKLFAYTANDNALC